MGKQYTWLIDAIEAFASELHAEHAQERARLMQELEELRKLHDHHTDREFIRRKFAEGERAAVDDACPYESSSLAGMWWERGFRLARAEAAEQALRPQQDRKETPRKHWCGICCEFSTDDIEALIAHTASHRQET